MADAQVPEWFKDLEFEKKLEALLQWPEGTDFETLAYAAGLDPIEDFDQSIRARFANLGKPSRVPPSASGAVSDVVSSSYKSEPTISLMESPPLTSTTLSLSHQYVFLSYSRADSAMAIRLRDALNADGVTVWLDLDIALGQRFRDEIDRRLDEAKAVVVLWSTASTTSDYVVSEAERGRIQEKLTPVLLGQVDPPPGFDSFNSINLSNWDGDSTHSEYRKLLQQLRPEITRSSGIGVRVDANKLVPEQEPISAPMQNANDEAKAQAIQKQITLCQAFLFEFQRGNTHPVTERRLRNYIRSLEDSEPLWSILDSQFAAIKWLLDEDEGMDAELKVPARRLMAGHRALREFLDKVGSLPHPEIAPELGPEDLEAVEIALAVAADMLNDAPFGEDAPAFLKGRADELALEKDGPDTFSEGGDKHWRRRMGQISYLTLGFLGALGSAINSSEYSKTSSGEQLLFKLAEITRKLNSLLRFRG